MSLLLFSLKTQYLPLSSGLDNREVQISEFWHRSKIKPVPSWLQVPSSERDGEPKAAGCDSYNIIHHHPPSNTNSVDSPYPSKKDSHIQVGVTAITVSRASPTSGAWRLYPASSTSMELTYQVIRLLQTQSWPYRWMHFNHSRVFWLMPELQQEFIIRLSVCNWPASPRFALLVSMVPWSPPSWIHPKSILKKSVLVTCYSHITYLLKKFKSSMSWTL